MSAFTYDHDAEARSGTLAIRVDQLERAAASVWLGRPQSIVVLLSDDEAIELYEILRAQWAGYVAERDEARRTMHRAHDVAMEALAEEWEKIPPERREAVRERIQMIRDALAAPDDDEDDEGFDPDLARDIERGK